MERMTTQRTFEPHEFAPYAEANNICRHCDRGRYALHHEQPRPEQATTEFDQVFDQMEAPEYPATCDNCGEVGTNASMEQHECDEHDAPAAPERGKSKIPANSDYDSEAGKWAVSKPMTTQIIDSDLRRGKVGTMPIYSIDVPESDGRIHFGGVVVFGDQRRTEQIVNAMNQHSTLITQRERLLEALKGVAIMLNTELEKYDSEPWAQRVREAITTSEQEGR